MFLNPMPKNQQGFLLPLAVFIVVVMGIFALVLSRNTIQSNTSSVQEAVTTEAFYAAESGAQLGMQKLFFPDASTRQLVDQRCVVNDVNTLPINKTYNKGTANDVPGLNNCTISVTCTCNFADDTNCAPITASNYTSTAAAKRLISFYKITSVATCGSSTLKSVRTIDVGSFMKQE